MMHCRYPLLRKKDGETGPASPGLRAAAHPKPASIFIDNPTCDPQAKTSTILTFCGEKWLKNSSPILNRNTRSVVCNENTDAAPCQVSPIPRSYNVQLECSFRGQSFQRIPHKIGEYLGNLAGKAAYDVLRVVSLLDDDLAGPNGWAVKFQRSEEHTSELQSRLHLVCRLLLEKKKKMLYT